MSDASHELMLPREAAKFIAQNSADVTISEKGVEKTARLIVDSIRSEETLFDAKRWCQHTLNPKTGDRAAIEWIFLSDLLNFSFWSDDESKKFSVRYAGESWTGYWSLCACINRALDEGVPFTDPGYFRRVTLDELKHIFRSDTDTPMPLIEERLQVLHEAGAMLCDNYESSFHNMLSAANQSAQTLLKLVTDKIPSFNDVTTFNGRRVALWKRAQILIADIWACCGGKGYGEFCDIDTITMFADYRIPQCLVWFEALQYSPSLTERLHKGEAFITGEPQEVEIRGCSIHAVELIVQQARRMLNETGNKTTSGDNTKSGKETTSAEKETSTAETASTEACSGDHVNAILVDHFLWDYRRAHAKQTEHIPIHKIRCIYY